MQMTRGSSERIWTDDELLDGLRSNARDAQQELVQRIRQDKEAANTAAPGLVLMSSAYRPRVIPFLRRLCFGRDENALEAWNDTLFRVWDKIETFDETKSTFRTWVFNQARYAGMAITRREGRQGRPVPVEQDRAEDDVPEPRTQREQRALQTGWKRLSETEQEFLKLRFIEGYEPVEIARRFLGGRIPEEHVRVYVNRAVQRLRRFYDEELRR